MVFLRLGAALILGIMLDERFICSNAGNTLEFKSRS